jgi:hypothetical protein
MSRFHPLHLLPLAIATVFIPGGMMPLWDGAGAIREYGLPERIASSKEAQTAFIIYGSRMTAWGFGLWIFYSRRDFKAFDTMLALLFYLGLNDLYVCWREGEQNQGIFRFGCGLLISSWGFFGMTSRTARP